MPRLDKAQFQSHPLWPPPACREGTGRSLQASQGETAAIRERPLPPAMSLPCRRSPARRRWAHSPARAKPSKAAVCQAPAGAAFYCCNHKRAPDRADLKHTCHQKGEPQPPSTWLQESSCTLFKAHLLTRVSPCLFFFFIVVLPLPSTFRHVPGSQLLLLALLQGWDWEVLLAPCHRGEHGPG